MLTDLIPNIPASPAFEKAKSLFLLQAPEPATDDAWNLYTINRLGAPQHHKFITDSEDEDQERLVPNEEFLSSVTSALNALEVKMGFEDDFLWKCHRVLHCDAHYGGDRNFYEDSEVGPESVGPENIRVITRIYSLNKPLYVDVCLMYQWLFGDDDVGFNYFMAFKIHTSPAEDDYNSTEILKLREEGSKKGFTEDGWRVIAYGYNAPESEALRNVFLLKKDDVKNIHEALWGPQEDIPEDADQERKFQCRQELVKRLCILFAAVGINCNIACTDSKEDKDLFTCWEFGRIRSWIGREVRRACGFQLNRDIGQVSQDKGSDDSTDEDEDENENEGWDDNDGDSYDFDME